VNSVQLSSWFKNLNDYLLLSGMEEGLHPAGVTEFLYSASLPSKLDQLNTKSYKYYSAGFRTKIYGDASTPGYVKIGIELRDVTRDLAKLRRIASRVADSISLRSWEQPVSTKAKLLSLSQDSAKSLHNVRARLIRSGADAEQVKQAFLSEPNITLPLIPFEDLVKSSGKALPPEAAARIHKARVHFESELGLLGAEMARMKTAGQDFDRAELGMAIRMILSDWAKRAQLSSIYEDLI
jgi:hypothetical protein